MSRIFLWFQLIFLPIQAFSGLWEWLLGNSDKDQKVDFSCPYHCGEWGSPSIQSLEWEFVQCLYTAHEMENYICQNYEKRRKEFRSSRYSQAFTPEEFPFRYTQPQNFNSSWYQKALDTNEYWFIVLSECIPDYYGCERCKSAYWKISHINDEKGNHLGKYFVRILDQEGYDYSYETPAADDELADEDEGPYFLETKEKNKYSFGNFIDFSHACLSLEHDLLLLKNANRCRSYEYSPLFVAQIENRYQQAHHSVCTLQNKYHTLFASCAQNHGSPSAYYNLALNELIRGEYEGSLDYFRSLFDKVKWETVEPNLASTLHQTAGALEAEVTLYDTAILKLSKAIELDPKNKEAYFERAFAYFEIGEFELAIQDFSQKGSKAFFPIYPEDFFLINYATGIALGASKGVGVATIELLPSICNSVRGIGSLLWATVAHPLDSSKHFASCILEFYKFFSDSDPTELVGVVVPEMQELIVNWKQLPSQERGEQMGYIIGKYGTDILLPAAMLKGVKCVKAYHEIRKAEKLCALKTLTHSSESKRALEQAAARWNAHRTTWFQRVELEIDKQNKHIRGRHNFDRTRSEWTYAEPEKKIKELAGKGQKIKGELGYPGYKERVDCGELIGYYIDDKTKEKLPTSMAIIHYCQAKNGKIGAHIVPAKPK